MYCTTVLQLSHSVNVPQARGERVAAISVKWDLLLLLLLLLFPLPFGSNIAASLSSFLPSSDANQTFFPSSIPLDASSPPLPCSFLNS